ncbi:hypothetical protein J3F84DRAFT_399904 [Trichoderma pleuroticola]
MMKQAQTLPQKSLTVQKRFINLIKSLEENEILNDIYSRDATDALERFCLWAGNLGALREPNSKLSIEYRLADAPEVRIEIHRQLDYLLETIDDVATIVQESQTNCELKEDDKDIEHFDNFGDAQQGPAEEIRMNFELISVSLKALFRIAVLIRKTSPDCRFERAIHSSKFTFPHAFDVDHVREKHPKLKTEGQSWLAERLGKAIAGRRQFIKYCRDHRDRLALDDENIEAESATTVIQSSKATTLKPEKIQAVSNFAVDDYEDDVVSILSISTITDVLSILALPRLEDLSKDVCTLSMTSDLTLAQSVVRNVIRWLSKTEIRGFNMSLIVTGLSMSAHCATFSEHQLRVMEDAGRRAPVSLEASTCPFCDDWSVALQTKDKSKSQEIEGKSILVRASQFKRHVAAHLEQLAIFAIPCAKEDGTGDERSSVDSLGSTITDLPESEIQEALLTPGEESLEGRPTDDEDLLNADEGKDDDPSSPEQSARRPTYPITVPKSFETSTNKFRDVDVANDIRPPFSSAVRDVYNLDRFVQRIPPQEGKDDDLSREAFSRMVRTMQRFNRLFQEIPPQEQETMEPPLPEHVEEEAATPEAKWTAQEQNPVYGVEVPHMATWVAEEQQARNEESETSVSNSPSRCGKDAKPNEGEDMATATSSEERVEERGTTYKRVRVLVDLPTQNRIPQVDHSGFGTVNTAQNKKNSDSVDSSNRKQHTKMQTMFSENLVHEQSKQHAVYMTLGVDAGRIAVEEEIKSAYMGDYDQKESEERGLVQADNLHQSYSETAREENADAESFSQKKVIENTFERALSDASFVKKVAEAKAQALGFQRQAGDQECVTSTTNRRGDDAVFDENWLGKEGIFQGHSTLLLGKIRDGNGIQVDVKTGDVIILPAGTAHSSLRSSDDYRYIGVYPKECPKWTNEMGQRPPASFVQTIGAVATPQADPVYGKQGPLVSLWNAKLEAKL